MANSGLQSRITEQTTLGSSGGSTTAQTHTEGPKETTTAVDTPAITVTDHRDSRQTTTTLPKKTTTQTPPEVTRTTVFPDEHRTTTTPGGRTSTTNFPTSHLTTTTQPNRTTTDALDNGRTVQTQVEDAGMAISFSIPIRGGLFASNASSPAIDDP